MFGTLGTPELLIIFALVLIIFGPKSLPKIGQALGRGIREFKDATSGIVNEDLKCEDDNDPAQIVSEEEDPEETITASASKQQAQKNA